MNLLRVFSRSTALANEPIVVPSMPSTIATDTTPLSRPELTDRNVVQLTTPIGSPEGLNARLDSGQTAPALSTQPRGLLDAPELKAFFAENHFGLGRHNGSNYRTQEALELGQRSLVSQFQNVLAELIERRQAKADRLTDKILETEGLCSVTTGRLREACTRLDREMSVLQEQFSSAGERKGWILEALNRYQIGFGKGMREAIEFELLMD
jgi:hypothetical protein